MYLSFPHQPLVNYWVMGSEKRSRKKSRSQKLIWRLMRHKISFIFLPLIQCICRVLRSPSSGTSNFKNSTSAVMPLRASPPATTIRIEVEKWRRAHEWYFLLMRKWGPSIHWETMPSKKNDFGFSFLPSWPPISTKWLLFSFCKQWP